MNGARAAIPAMLLGGGGVIVNISSIGGLFGARGGAAFAASKHGLIGLTKNVAATYGREGVRAVAVCAGAVDTGISLGGEPSPQGLRGAESDAAGEPARPDGARDPKLGPFLVSDEASFVNGAAIVADGGLDRRVAGAGRGTVRPDIR